jgi:hypothetical protein
MRRSRSRLYSLVAATLLPLSMLTIATLGSPAESASAVKWYAPNATSEMDCNGHSPVYKDVKQDLGGGCTDPVGFWDGKAWRFEDNGAYVGHDEPSVKFISSTPGSGNTITYEMRIASTPAAAPTTTAGGKVTHYAELSPAPWFGLAMCDTLSYPVNPCTPDSDANQSQITNPADAGSAFMELQFYPPGFGPFIDAPSCTATKWCAALTIDSLEARFNFATLNGACEEPVNFAYLQRNGVPTGPPSPQLTNDATFTPNAETLELNGGDTVRVTIHDTPTGLYTGVTDLSTGQSGYMVASAENGFMHTNPTNCDGTPYNFHPEFTTAAKQNQVPWAALEGGVLMEQEIGHFEVCTSVTNTLGYSTTIGGTTFSDPTTFQTCIGGSENATGPGSQASSGPTRGHHNTVGEGPCYPTSFLGEYVCTYAHVDTQAGTYCPSDSPTSGALCEFSDATCVPKGPRTVTFNGTAQTWSWPVTGCQDNYFQNGDLDFEGIPYQPGAWPDGSANHPTSFAYTSPTSHGSPYPDVQFETDIAGSENTCNTLTGTGCTAPPIGANFYPFWSLGQYNGLGCVWNFGTVVQGATTNTFNGDEEYGTPDTARYGGTLASAVLPNPDRETSFGQGGKNARSLCARGPTTIP